MGDHVPAFLLRELRVEDTGPVTEGPEVDAVAEAVVEVPVVEAAEPAKLKPRARRSRKAAETETSAAPTAA